ncbi:hypothetical protein SLNWT_6699 [Streptomyces albus]|uniref:DNA primase n=1 Tax=Streptomyces albus (strain ATCC 21838 / DSM 41398 / FERM P-419 / JCM 4703 / NBRC 107858) TaxID=1081613 RepID=A0A0B5F645_STRA4|nr:hypothetical protein SLNWT_6699 [Streptomyces albus]AOU81380.1 hypothetical protein SLNHY_6689 [Streptomyces albus]AYN37073.1 hypothetical protein DUI70_6580 [Streptomyces albus]
MTNIKIGAALAGGYLLGRTKKAKLAIGFGMFLAGKKLDLDPRALAKTLAASPALSGLNQQVRKELVDATKSAATDALTKRVSGLADSLQDRTKAIGTADSSRRADQEEDEAGDAEEDGRAARGDGGDGEEAEETRPKKTAARRKAPARKTGTPTRKSQEGGRRSREGSASVPKARGEGSPARKRTAAAAKKTSASARKARGERNG